MARNSGRSGLSQRIFFSCLGLSALVAFVIAFAGLRKVPEAPLWKGVPGFRARNAFEYTRHLSRSFPNRVPWRPERQAASNYLQGEFRKLGYDVSTIGFDEVIGGRHVDGLENVLATLPGVEVPEEYIVVLAHYDIVDTTVEGAADDASGVGTVLELARVFKEGPAPRRNIIFMATDSEEFGAFWGARKFIEKFPDSSKIVAAISLDFVAPDVQQDIMVLTDGLKSGYSPLWIRELALASIRAVPYKADDTRHAVEFMQRAILIPPAEHGIFLAHSIPAITLFGRSTDFTHEMGAIHHTPEDNMSHLRVESFEPYGKATEILVRTIDQLPQMLQRPWVRSSQYWKLTPSLYINGPAAIAIQVLAFLPFLVYVALMFAGLRGRRSLTFRVMRGEIKSYVVLFASFLAGYGLLRLLPDLKIITQYELFPATQKSVILYKPTYPALLLVFALITVLYLMLSRIFLKPRDEASTNNVEREIRHTLLGIILAAIVVLAFARNPWLATTLLLPPAYLWMFMKSSRTIDSRAFNGLLFLGGLVSFIAICIAMTMVFHVGIFYWYMFLAISYGLISVYAAILSFAVLTVGIRILRNLVL